MHSFAVINLAGRNDRCALELMTRFQNIAKSHGIQMPDIDEELLSGLISHSSNSYPSLSEVRAIIAY